jgi:ATP-dependent Lon protease
VKDLEEIPDNVKKGLTLIPVNHVDQVLQHALASAPIPIRDWVEVEDASLIKSGSRDEEIRPH